MAWLVVRWAGLSILKIFRENMSQFKSQEEVHIHSDWAV